MSNTVSAVANIVRGLVSLGILGVLGTGGWFAYTAYDAREQLHRELAEQSAQIEALSQRNQQLAEHNQKLTEENEKLNLALRLLKVDHRVAQI